MPSNLEFGFLNIDKPFGVTSHGVVAQVRRELGVKKVGHAGTLDPLATGVLVLCLGPATRLSQYAMQSVKRYQAHVHLGVVTETWDAEGKIVQERDASSITKDMVARALATFVGAIEQVPPMYSAIKQGGRKLYQLARAGKTVERRARQVQIDKLALVDWSPPLLTVDVTCGTGTYIRSLAYDLGEMLGVGAHLAGLVRAASGHFYLEHSVKIDKLLSSENWQEHLLPPDTVLMHWPAIMLDEAMRQHILHGRAIMRDHQTPGDWARAYGPDGQFLAILRSDDGIWRPHKVFLAR